MVALYFKINGECLALNTNLDRVTKRHDHHELRPRLLGHALHAQDGTAATADVAELLEDHDVPGERARLVGEEVRHEAQLLVDVGRVAPAPRYVHSIKKQVPPSGIKECCRPGWHVPLGVVQLQVPSEELASGELLQLDGDVHGYGDEVAVKIGATGFSTGN